MEIVKLDFVKKGPLIDLSNAENIKNIVKHILPVIEGNVGWGSASLTKESFLNNPFFYQDLIDSTISNNVHVVYQNSFPVAILEFKKEVFERSKYSGIRLIKKLLEDTSDKRWEEIIKYANIPDSFVPPLEIIEEILRSKPLYYEVGVVLHQDLQGTKSGISETLYNILSDGFVFGWTNNPVVIRQRKKLFSNTLLYPLFDEEILTQEQFASHLYVFSDWEYDEEEQYEFGVLESEYFVQDRGKEYIELAKSMNSLNKISNLDTIRLIYSLERKSTSCAVVSWN